MALSFWNTAKTAHTATLGEQARSRVAQLTDGSIVVAWEDDSSGNFDMKFQRFDAQGKKLGSETTAHFPSASDQQYAGVAALSGGGFVISYTDVQANILFAQKFTAAGVAVGGPIALSNPTLSTAFSSVGPPVLQPLANNEFAVVYQTFDFGGGGTGFDLVGRVVNAAGVPQPAFPIMFIQLDEQLNPSIASDGLGGFVTVFTHGTGSATDILFTRFTNTGASLGPPLMINQDTTGTQDLAAVARLTNGRFVVTWLTTNGADGWDIHGQIIDQNGTQIGPEFLVNASTASAQRHSRIAPLADGKFMVVYGDDLGTTGSSLRAQLFSPNGTMVGSEITLTTTSPFGSTNISDLVVLADGRVAVVWSEDAAATENLDVMMQIIDPREGFFRGSANADVIYGHDGNTDFILGLSGGDTILGLAGNDTLNGDAGNDTLNGGRGDDTLSGGADQDSMIGGLGADDMDGGDGVDTASYALASFAVTASLDGTLLGTNEAAFDTYVSIENLTGSNLAAQGDTLRGNAVANSIAGLAGNDTLNGAAGHDRLTGGTGNDTMTGGIGNDSFIYNTLTEGGDIITDFSSFAANNNDVFRLKGSVFGGLAAGGITNVQFQSSTADVAANTSIRFFYETDTGILRFDADGSDPGAAVTIATLQVGATMTFNDILIF